MNGEGEFHLTYSLELNGCEEQADLMIHILAVPDEPIISNSEIQVCHEEIIVGVGVELEVGGGPVGTLYHWFRDGESESFDQGLKITVEPDQTTIYNVQAENVFGCLSTHSEILVTVVDIDADFSVSDSTVVFGGRVDFSTDYHNAQSYLWDFGDDLTSVQQNSSHYYYDDGVFTVELHLVSEDGCKETIVKEGLITVEAYSLDIVVGLQNEEIPGKYEDVRVYPLPFDEVFVIDIYSERQGSVAISIYDISGEVVFMERAFFLVVGDNRIVFDRSELNIGPGLYVMRLFDKKSERFIKLIKR